MKASHIVSVCADEVHRRHALQSSSIHNRLHKWERSCPGVISAARITHEPQHDGPVLTPRTSALLPPESPSSSSQKCLLSPHCCQCQTLFTSVSWGHLTSSVAWTHHTHCQASVYNHVNTHLEKWLVSQWSMTTVKHRKPFLKPRPHHFVDFVMGALLYRIEQSNVMLMQ